MLWSRRSFYVLVYRNVKIWNINVCLFFRNTLDFDSNVILCYVVIGSATNLHSPELERSTKSPLSHNTSTRSDTSVRYFMSCSSYKYHFIFNAAIKP